MTISTTALLAILALIFGQCATMNPSEEQPLLPHPGWTEDPRECPEEWTKGADPDGEEWECRLESEPDSPPDELHEGEQEDCTLEWVWEREPDGSTKYEHGELKCRVDPEPRPQTGTGFSGFEYSRPNLLPDEDGDAGDGE